MENLSQTRNLFQRFNLGSYAMTPTGERIEVMKVEKVLGREEARYNGIYWDSDLASLELKEARKENPTKDKVPVFAYQNLKNGDLILKTRPFSGNQYIRAVELSEFSLS